MRSCRGVDDWWGRQVHGQPPRPHSEPRVENADAVVRSAAADDVDEIAGLHAESWRRYYRGAYADEYLDADLYADRLRLWSKRLAIERHDCCTLVAEKRGVVVGFVHLELDADPLWGALVDNLHVSCGSQGEGLGTQLLAEAARWAHERRGDSGIYLWVLKQNLRAQSFYLARGARLAELAPVPPPDGKQSSLAGRPLGMRVVWADGDALKRLRGVDEPVLGSSS